MVLGGFGDEKGAGRGKTEGRLHIAALAHDIQVDVIRLAGFELQWLCESSRGQCPRHHRQRVTDAELLLDMAILYGINIDTLQQRKFQL